MLGFWVARDEDGKIVEAGLHRLKAVRVTNVAEAEAVREALKHAMSKD